MSKMTRLTGINTTMKHAPAEPTLSHLAFVTCILGHCPSHGGKVLKDEIQSSNSKNCILKQEVDMLGNNNRVQHNATQRCNPEPADDTIVHWRNGRPGIGDVLSGTLSGWVRMMDNIALRCEKYRAHPNFWASPRQIFQMSPYLYRCALYQRADGMWFSHCLRLGQECMLCAVFSFWIVDECNDNHTFDFFCKWSGGH